MERFLELLREGNRVMDLTAVPEEAWPERHILDSVLPFFRVAEPPRGRWIDVGTGAGFPGMPLAILFPDTEFTLLDAQEKRCAFLKNAARELKCENVTVVCGRAEEAGRAVEHRETYDGALSRAVARLNVLAEYMIPFLKPGGRALCWKGPGGMEETDAGSRAGALLGAGPWQTLSVAGFEEERLIMICDKLTPTPDRYPRRNGIPAKRPLG